MATTDGLIKGSVTFFYLLIGLEIVIMISPFAGFFYAGYGPLLDFLYGIKTTAWLTGFFLPHAVYAKNNSLNFLNALGRSLFSLGLIAFLVGAVQVYSAKFRRKGIVSSMLYRWVRHPQYLFLAISGLGLLLFWPRFLILVLYISMLFVYYILARNEEDSMLKQHGDSYAVYMQRTAMFVPGEPGGKIFRAFFGWIKSPTLALAVGYGVTLFFALLMAFGLRHYTISQISTIYLPKKQITVISILPHSDEAIQEALDVAYQDSLITTILSNYRQKGHKGFLVHLMPVDYMMQGLFVTPFTSEARSIRISSWRSVVRFVFPLLSRHSHQKRMGRMNNKGVRLVFSQLTWPDGKYAPADRALDFSVKHLPLLKVDIDLEKNSVQELEKTLNRNLWGQMPMPSF
ncbi:MAG: isoprenylcysteine carboxylmethyltransferase family protein [Desulfobacterales bacterium]|nr:MAG: isoprenylcysteine carboxylmethyltransferase family protein [Desulfobacterales bacterium]